MPRHPDRPLPRDFEETFLREGRAGCEAHYRARRETITKWLVEFGIDRLRAARAAQPWRKITGSEHAGPDGSPLQIVATARRDLSHLSDDELETFRRLTAKLEAPDASTPK